MTIITASSIGQKNRRNRAQAATSNARFIFHLLQRIRRRRQWPLASMMVLAVFPVFVIAAVGISTTVSLSRNPFGCLFRLFERLIPPGSRREKDSSVRSRLSSAMTVDGCEPHQARQGCPRGPDWDHQFVLRTTAARASSALLTAVGGRWRLPSSSRECD